MINRHSPRVSLSLVKVRHGRAHRVVSQTSARVSHLYFLPFVSSNEVTEMFYVGRRNEHIFARIGIG